MYEIKKLNMGISTQAKKELMAVYPRVPRSGQQHASHSQNQSAYRFLDQWKRPHITSILSQHSPANWNHSQLAISSCFLLHKLVDVWFQASLLKIMYWVCERKNLPYAPSLIPSLGNLLSTLSVKSVLHILHDWNIYWCSSNWRAFLEILHTRPKKIYENLTLSKERGDEFTWSHYNALNFPS